MNPLPPSSKDFNNQNGEINSHESPQKSANLAGHTVTANPADKYLPDDVPALETNKKITERKVSTTTENEPKVHYEKLLVNLKALCEKFTPEFHERHDVMQGMCYGLSMSYIQAALVDEAKGDQEAVSAFEGRLALINRDPDDGWKVSGTTHHDLYDAIKGAQSFYKEFSTEKNKETAYFEFASQHPEEFALLEIHPWVEMIAHIQSPITSEGMRFPYDTGQNIEEGLNRVPSVEAEAIAQKEGSESTYISTGRWYMPVAEDLDNILKALPEGHYAITVELEGINHVIVLSHFPETPEKNKVFDQNIFLASDSTDEATEEPKLDLVRMERILLNTQASQEKKEITKKCFEHMLSDQIEKKTMSLSAYKEMYTLFFKVLDTGNDLALKQIIKCEPLRACAFIMEYEPHLMRLPSVQGNAKIKDILENVLQSKEVNKMQNINRELNNAIRDKKGKESVESYLKNGAIPNDTAIELAVYSGSVEVTELLIEAGANVGVLVKGETLLFEAVRSGNIEMTKLLLLRCFTIEVLEFKNQEGKSVFDIAKDVNDTELTALLQRKKDDISVS